MAKYCDVEYLNGKLLCHLPITTPTGKVRVLRDNEPVATRSTQLHESDIVEWQISYFADEHKKMVELANLLDLAYHYNMVQKNEIEQLLREIEKQRELFAEKYSITIDAVQLPENFYGFSVLKKTVPILVKDVDNILIWIELRHKQRAVGFQPMLFLRIPIEGTSPNLVGKMAELKQIVSWEPPISILLTTVKAFSIAPSNHRKDMIEVLTRILKI